MKAYSKLFFKKGVNSAPKDNLVAVSDFFTILASPTALHFWVVTTIEYCEELPNLI